jgi:hypothetical protein
MSEKLTIEVPAGLLDSLLEKFWNPFQDQTDLAAMNRFCVHTIGMKLYSDDNLPDREAAIRDSLITMASNDEDSRTLEQIARAQSDRVAQLEKQLRVAESEIERLERSKT